MRSTHRIIVAAALAVSAAAGTAAATRTVHLGADTRDAAPISAAALAAQKAKLAAADQSIDRALAARPPALPRVPRFHPLGNPRVPPLLVTRVVPMTSPAVTADTGDDPPAADAGSHRSRPPAATTPVPTGAPAPVRADDDAEDHHASGGEEHRGGDHADDQEDGGSEHHAAEPEHHDD
jgi:hypothetical protein